MEAIFDDLSHALREPRADIWGSARAFALDFAGTLFTGLAVGLGIAIGLALAG